MTETIRYGLLGKEDIRFGTGTFEVELADGRRVVLTEVDVGALLGQSTSSPLRLSEYALASLPAVTGVGGRVARLTNDIGGVVLDSGNFWVPLLPGVVNAQDAPFHVHPTRTAAQNAAGIQAALDTGKSVRLPPGTISYNTTLNVAVDGQALFGAGQSRTILSYTGTGNGIEVGSATVNLTGCAVRDFRLTGPGTTAQHGIALGDRSSTSIAPRNTYLGNLYISGWNQTAYAGVFAANVVTTYISNCFFTGNYNGFQDATTATSTTTTLVNCYFQSQTNNGAYLRRGQGTRFLACTIEGSGAEAIKADSITSNVQMLDILGCWFENNNLTSGTYTIVLTGAVGRSVAGGEIRGGSWAVNAGKKHIQLDRAEDVLVDIYVLGSDTPVTTTANAARVVIHGRESTFSAIPVLTPITSGIGLVYTQATAYGNVYSIIGKTLTGHETAGTTGRVLLSGATIGGKGAGTLNTWGDNADDEVLALSYHGHEDSANFFRDTAIYDGKEGRVAFFDGSTKGATFDGGVQLGAPTGGNKGAGTLNAAADIYKNNTAFTNPKWVLKRHYTGAVDSEGSYAAPPDYVGLRSFDDLEALLREHHDLPLMLLAPNGGLFERGDLLLASVEEAYLYLCQLHARVKRLETEWADD